MTTDHQADTARQNGAKSQGPTTPEGKDRCRQAPTKAAARRAAALPLYSTLLPTEPPDVLAAIKALEFSFWKPSTPSEIQMVNELSDINWRIRRIRRAQTNDLAVNMESQRHYANVPELEPIMAPQAELAGSAAGGNQTILDRRIAILSACRSRILRDLERLAKLAETRKGSQASLQSKNLPIEVTWKVPASWSELPPDSEPNPSTPNDSAPSNPGPHHSTPSDSAPADSGPRASQSHTSDPRPTGPKDSTPRSSTRPDSAPRQSEPSDSTSRHSDSRQPEPSDSERRNHGPRRPSRRRPIPTRALLSRVLPTRALPHRTIPHRAIPTRVIPRQAIPSAVIPARALPALAIPARNHPLPSPNYFGSKCPIPPFPSLERQRTWHPSG